MANDILLSLAIYYHWNHDLLIHIASNVYKIFLQYSWYEIYICIRQEANILV